MRLKSNAFFSKQDEQVWSLSTCFVFFKKEAVSVTMQLYKAANKRKLIVQKGAI